MRPNNEMDATADISSERQCHRDDWALSQYKIKKKNQTNFFGFNMNNLTVQINKINPPPPPPK